MRICESSSAELFHEVALFFLNEIYTHISHLSSNAPKYKQETSVKKSSPVRITKKKISEQYINFTRDFIFLSYHIHILD